jgi:hypothetical protein
MPARMKKILPSAILLIQAALGAQIRNDAVAERLSNAGAVQRGRVLQVQSGDVNAKPVKWRQTSIRPYATVDSDRPFALDGTFWMMNW